MIAGQHFHSAGPYLNSYAQTASQAAETAVDTHLRRIGARTFTDVFKAIGELCDLFDPNECWNYFKAAGYVAG